MATMKDMWSQMIEKMAGQAEELGKLRYEKAHYEKASHEWERRALQAEQKLADGVEWQLSSENNYQAYKAEQQKVYRLDAKMDDALDIIEALAAEEGLFPRSEYTEKAQVFIEKWAQRQDPYNGLGESLLIPYPGLPKEASNGQTGILTS